MEHNRIFLLVAILVLCIFGISHRIRRVQVDEMKDLFDTYISKFNKTYGKNDVEYLERFNNFKNSLKLIQHLNSNHANMVGGALYGLTVFSDLSQTEFAKTYLLASKNLQYQKLYKNENDGVPEDPDGRKVKRSTVIPFRVDWRTRGIIGAIHDQRTCGACWAFSTIETVEAMNALKSGTLVELSVQEMIDCAQNGNHGCEGGDSCSLLNWLTMTKAKVTTDKFYPFTHKTGYCNAKALKTGVQIANFTCDSFSDSEDKMLEKLAFHGPIAAAVNALNWQNYLGGIIQYHCSGAPQNLNHAVQVVGFDRTGPVPFYIVRNSWGPDFGNSGYLYIAIGNNVCGLASQVTSLDVV